MADRPVQQLSFDSLIPADMALKAQQTGIKKAELDALSTICLSVLAGAFIALGAVFSTTVVAGSADSMPYGIVRLLAGVAFCLGLILVVVAGAELFTGNNLIVMAWASGQVSTKKLLRNWALVYLGNFAGSVLTALIMFWTGQYEFGRGAVGLAALTVAQAKVSLGFLQAIALGVMCNALVCLAVWLCFSARSTTDRILSIVFPISAFVAASFEHSVANMYFIPIGLLIRQFGTAEFWQLVNQSAADYPSLNWPAFLLRNLLPVTLGNIVGGAGLVGVVYWFIYLRPKFSPVPPKVPDQVKLGD